MKYRDINNGNMIACGAVFLPIDVHPLDLLEIYDNQSGNSIQLRVYTIDVQIF